MLFDPLPGKACCAALVVVACTVANACPDGYYNTAFGVCLPNSGTVVDTVRRTVTEALTQLGGPALEQWIVQSRNTAIGSAQPVPPHIPRSSAPTSARTPWTGRATRSATTASLTPPGR